MKSFPKLALPLIILLAHCSFLVKAQENATQALVNYRIHTVIKGETLYSICRQYDVKERDVAEINFGLIGGLMIGQALKIPPQKQDLPKAADVDFIYHKVKKKQTIYFVAKVYNITPKDIVRYNPDAKYGIKQGDVLKIPQNLVHFKDEQQLESPSFYYHTVAEDESMFFIGKKYGVTTHQILEHNLNFDGNLRKGLVLKIPNKSTDQPIVITIHGDTIDPFKEAIETEIIEPCTPRDKSETLQVAFMLPFCTQENKKLGEHAKNLYKNTEQFLQFYQGSLLALDSLSRKGIKLAVKVFDTQADPVYTKELLTQNDSFFSSVDLIIGPAYNKNFRIVSNYAMRKGINIVSPISKSVEGIDRNPYIFQANSSYENEIEKVARYLKKYLNKSIVIAHNGTPRDKLYAANFKRKVLEVAESEDYLEEVILKEINFQEAGASGLEDALSVGLQNYVFVPSTREELASQIVSQLNILSDSYKIILIGMPNWRYFKQLEIEYLHNLQMHYFTGLKIDYKTDKVRTFLADYRNLFREEPSVYSFQGFDISMYFISMLDEFGNKFQHCLNSDFSRAHCAGLQSKQIYRKVATTGGYINNAVHLMMCNNNFEIVELELSDSIEYFPFEKWHVQEEEPQDIAPVKEDGIFTDH